MQEQKQINRSKNSQFQNCAQCLYCARYIPLKYLMSHQRTCFARQNKDGDSESESESDSIQQGILEMIDLIKIQAKKSIDCFNQMFNQPQLVKKEQFSISSIQKISLKHSNGIKSDIVLLPCQNCLQIFSIQQFETHQNICFYGKTLAYKSCDFCGQAFPEDFCDQHKQVCPTRLELVKQTQIFNKKHQVKQIKPLKKKLKVTQQKGPNINNSASRKSVQNRNPGLNASKFIGSSVREVKKFQRSELKVQSHECSICFCSIKNSNKIYQLKCIHTFHQACLDPWLQSSNNCPMCKKIIETK